MKPLDIPARAILPIERIHKPDVRTFEREYAAAARPVVITGVASEWPASGAWPAARLVSECGDRQVEITHYEENSKFRARPIKMRVRDFLEAVLQRAPGSELLAWNGEHVSASVPELAAELRLPSLVRTARSDTVAFVAGPRQWPYRHVCNQLHYHPGLHAFAAQIEGRKLFRLYAPSESKWLYPLRWWASIPFRTTVEIHQHEPHELPLLANATCHETVLETGEMLFIPAAWWHLVANEDFAILVTTFYPAPISQWSFPFPAIPTMLDRIRRFRTWAERRRPGHRGLPLDVLNA